MNIEELKRLAEVATPGPWEYEDHGRLTGIIWGTNNYAIARLAYDGQVRDDKVAATGSYIAAANPAAVLELIRQRDELLVALKLMLSGGTGCLSAARSAIANAEKQS